MVKKSDNFFTILSYLVAPSTNFERDSSAIHQVAALYTVSQKHPRRI